MNSAQRIFTKIIDLDKIPIREHVRVDYRHDFSVTVYILRRVYIRPPL